MNDDHQPGVSTHTESTPSSRRGFSRDVRGEVVDERFQIGRQLGTGGMGAVYEGTQLSVERRVAVKFLHADLGETAEARFNREARLISELSHPGIVQLVDFGHDDDLNRPYLVMEYVDGVPLQRLVQYGRLQLPLALDIIDQLSGALAEAHANGIVHRDLKPGNVVLVGAADGSLLVKLLDFGIAYSSKGVDEITAHGVVNGTPRYLAPEQAKGDTVTAQADVYALGVMLFEMLVGNPPFEAHSPLLLLFQHVRAPLPSLPEEIPAPVSHLIRSMLAKDPAARPDGTTAVREQLREIRRRLRLPDVEVGDGGLDDFKAWLASGPVFETEKTSPVDVTMEEMRESLGGGWAAFEEAARNIDTHDGEGRAAVIDPQAYEDVFAPSDSMEASLEIESSAPDTPRSDAPATPRGGPADVKEQRGRPSSYGVSDFESASSEPIELDEPEEPEPREPPMPSPTVEPEESGISVGDVVTFVVLALLGAGIVGGGLWAWETSQEPETAPRPVRTTAPEEVPDYPGFEGVDDPEEVEKAAAETSDEDQKTVPKDREVELDDDGWRKPIDLFEE